MAAERAAELRRRPCASCRRARCRRGWPRPWRSTRRGRAPSNAAAMEEALATSAPAAVTEAARDDAEGRFRRGDAIGFVDEELVAWGEPGETLEVVLGELGPRGRAADRDRGRRRAAGPATRWPRWRPTASSSSSRAAASRASGGSSRPSSSPPPGRPQNDARRAPPIRLPRPASRRRRRARATRARPAGRRRSSSGREGGEGRPSGSG